MSDFHQTGVVATLHRLGRRDLERLERELGDPSRSRPVALVLPCLHSELHDIALKGIIDQLQRVPYLTEIVVSVAGAPERERQNDLESKQALIPSYVESVPWPLNRPTN